MGVRDLIVEAVRPTPLYAFARAIRDRIVVRRWRQTGRPIPPPHAIKVATVREYASARGISVLIETGTFRGAMIHAQLAHFRHIYSIEIDRALHSAAVRLFRRHRHVHLVLGDSSDALPRVLGEVRQPAVFWLDGHYSGGVTGRGALDSPIARELAHIWRHGRFEHVILIDDARHFTGQDGYPTIQELGEIVASHRPEWVCDVRDDIIRIHRPLAVT